MIQSAQKLAERILLAAKNKNMSQAAILDFLKINRSTLSRWRRGLNKPLYCRFIEIDNNLKELEGVEPEEDIR